MNDHILVQFYPDRQTSSLVYEIMFNVLPQVKQLMSIKM